MSKKEDGGVRRARIQAGWKRGVTKKISKLPTIIGGYHCRNSVKLYRSLRVITYIDFLYGLTLRHISRGLE